MKKIISLLVVIGVISGCSAISKLTVKEYTTSSGQKVTAGRYKPKAENQCQLKKQMTASWGFRGHMDPDGTYEDIVHHAVERAPKQNANYVYIEQPSDVSVGGLDVNYHDAKVFYYFCKNPPK